MEQHRVDIINVAGLLRTERHNGIEDAVLHRFQPHSFTTIAPTPPLLAAEDPERSIERAIGMVDEIIARLTRENPAGNPPDVILFGHSYGAFIALLVACRMRFQNIMRIILDEGPLNPDVEVKPPPLFPPLAACYQHYRERPRLGREAVSTLRGLGTSRVLIVQGTREDSVVPNASQVLPGDYRKVQLQSGADTAWTDSADPSGGLILQLPADIGGVPRGIKNPFPDSYSTHLLWSREKMDAITFIIEQEARALARSSVNRAA